MTQDFDVAVVGAGMLGASAAYRLTLAGLRVLVLEAGEPADGATGNTFSWLNAYHKEPEAYHRLNADGMVEYADLATELGEPFGLHRSGSLHWRDPWTEPDLQRELTRLTTRGYPARRLSRSEAAALAPGLDIPAGSPGLILCPDDGWVDAPRLCRLLLSRALAEGAELWRRTPVERLIVERGRIVAVGTPRGVTSVSRVLLCAGLGTDALLRTAGLSLPVQCVPGLLAVTTPVTAAPAQVVYAPGLHFRPDPDGGFRIGADDTDAAIVDAETGSEAVSHAAQTLLTRLRAYLPAAAGAELARIHIGRRPIPADGLTVAGPAAGIAGLWIAVTHSGVTLGPLLGRLLADAIAGGGLDGRLTAFGPERLLQKAD